MLNDAARLQSGGKDGKETKDGKPIVHRELKTKEDIKNYIKGII